MSGVILPVVVLALLNVSMAEPNTIPSTGCCSVNVEYLGDDTAIVYYTDSVVPEFSYSIYVEVEYPDPDMLDWDVLQELIDETVNRMQEDCYHNHNLLTTK